MIDDERHADAKIGPHRQTSAFYDVLPASVPRPIKPAGQWNESRVRVAPSRVVAGGTRVYHYLNGARVLRVRARYPGASRSNREEQVQGRRAVRQAAERPHPAPGSRRSRLVSQHQDPKLAADTPRRIRQRAQRPPAGPGRRERRGETRGRHDRRQAVHVVHLPGRPQEAGPLPHSHREWRARDARLSARSQARRTRRSSASRRPVVQPR